MRETVAQHSGKEVAVARQRLWAAFLMVCLLAPILCGCHKPNASVSLAGTWIASDRKFTEEWVLRPDDTCTITFSGYVDGLLRYRDVGEGEYQRSADSIVFRFSKHDHTSFNPDGSVRKISALGLEKTYAIRTVGEGKIEASHPADPSQKATFVRS